MRCSFASRKRRPLHLSPIKSTALTGFLILLGLIGLIPALRGSPRSGFFAGLALGLHGLYCFTAIFAGLMMPGLAPTAALYGVIPWRRAILVVVLVLLASSGVWVAAYFTSGFDRSA